MKQRELNGVRIEYNGDPDHCPRCHHGIEPVLLAINPINVQFPSAELLYRCPRAACQKSFIATYRQDSLSFGIPSGVFKLRSTTPWSPETVAVPAEVAAISKAYGELLNQSSGAEHFGLSEIAGAGYRKALEFLVKDFAVYKSPNQEDDIKKAFLGVVIDKYVNDQNVQKCARLATWLGNDETHYVRRWEEKDIKDLKVLIRLTEAWILNSLLTDKYVEDMNPKAAGAGDAQTTQS